MILVYLPKIKTVHKYNTTYGFKYIRIPTQTEVYSLNCKIILANHSKYFQSIPNLCSVLMTNAKFDFEILRENPAKIEAPHHQTVHLQTNNPCLEAIII